MARRLKKPVVYSLYAIGIVGLTMSIFLVNKINNYATDMEDEHQYVSKTNIKRDDDIAVVNTTVKLARPYIEGGVNIAKNYYDYKDTEENQEKSIIYYEGTYMPSEGVAYTKDDSFDVISVLDGKVEKIEENDTVGNIITIKHDKNIVSIYESVKDITVKEGDSVAQGDKIAKTGTSNIRKDLNNHLYFELKVNDKTVNPEKYFNKSIDEIGA